MTELVDQPARLRALTDLDATLLVEAAAGTGKTSLIAGRLTVLLASGASPASIAAITFTELAASELSVRVHRYVEQLLAGEISPSLLPAFPLGLRQAHRTALVAAAAKLDELTITTIHAFCQTIICSYAVEADIDPGAQILDATQAEAAFDAIFGQWLRRRLGDTAPPGDTIATLSARRPAPRSSGPSTSLPASTQTIVERARRRRTSAAGPTSAWSRPLANFAAGPPRCRLSQRHRPSSISSSCCPGSMPRASIPCPTFPDCGR